MQYPFFSTPLTALLASGVLLVATTGAMAQSTAPANTAPSTVGVTPQDASEAMRKAVPRTDTGTVVRTDESAPDKARDAVDTAQPNNTAAPAAAVRSDNNTTTTNPSTGTTAPGTAPPRARADRS